MSDNMAGAVHVFEGRGEKRQLGGGCLYGVCCCLGDRTRLNKYIVLLIHP